MIAGLLARWANWRGSRWMRRLDRERKHREHLKASVTPVSEQWLTQKQYSSGMTGEDQHDDRNDR